MKSSIKFEEKVRQTFRALWDLGHGEACADIVDGFERDSIFNDGEITHYAEMTTDGKTKKIRDDSEKMLRYREAAVKIGALVKLWYVTKDPPLGDQVKFCRERGIKIVSLKELQRLLVDGPEYIKLRPQQRFGSAVDPRTDRTDLNGVIYQPTEIRVLGSREKLEGIGKIAQLLNEKKIVVILGDYGMGKSITLHKVHQELAADFLRNDAFGSLPVAINLRECWGLETPTEMLHRHVRSLGLKGAEKIVKAFNAGLLIPLLDGFDEITSEVNWISHTHEPGEPIAGALRVNKRLQNIRRHAASLIREVIDYR